MNGGHLSDNRWYILAMADHRSQIRISNDEGPLIMCKISETMIITHKIQGIIEPENSFSQTGLYHVLLVHVAFVSVVIK